MTRLCNVSSKLSKRSDSVSLIFVNGMPVQPAITSPISSSDKDVFAPFWLFFQLLFASSYCFSNLVCLSRKLAAFSNSCACTAASFHFSLAQFLVPALLSLVVLYDFLVLLLSLLHQLSQSLYLVRNDQTHSDDLVLQLILKLHQRC